MSKLKELVAAVYLGEESQQRHRSEMSMKDFWMTDSGSIEPQRKGE